METTTNIIIEYDKVNGLTINKNKPLNTNKTHIIIRNGDIIIREYLRWTTKSFLTRG